MCRHQRMSERIESPPSGEPASLTAMRSRFRSSYEERCCFREDAALAELLAREASPVLEALFTAFVPGDGPRATHEAYALSTLLARTLGLAGATPTAVLALAEALCEALVVAGVPVDPTLARALAIVTLEGYCAARDERSQKTLRQAAAATQRAIKLGPHCIAIYLSGSHEEADLAPILENFSRRLLREDAHACLLDVAQLDAEHEEIARLVAQLCATAASLGVRTFVVGASLRLRARLAAWLALGDRLQHVDDIEHAQAQALSAAGLEVRPRARWTALRFWDPRHASGR